MWREAIVNMLRKKSNENNDLGRIVNKLRKKPNKNNDLALDGIP